MPWPTHWLLCSCVVGKRTWFWERSRLSTRAEEETNAATLSASPSSAPMSLRSSVRRCNKVRKLPHKGSKPARLRWASGSRASGFLEEGVADRRIRKKSTE